MRLLVVVQRYGAEIAGGSERAAREFASRLAARGHDVTVATGRARSYVTWADELAGGTSHDAGVRVVRFDVVAPRDLDRFLDLQNRVLGAAYLGRQVPLLMQESWIRECGPLLGGFEEWLVEESGGFDVAIIFTYQYATAWMAARALRGRVPVVLHPTAHAELTFYLDVFTELFAAADGIGYLTEEEQSLVLARGGVRDHAVATVCGIGVEPAADVVAGEIQRVRDAYGLGSADYAVCVGRIDEGKGTTELVELHRRAAVAHEDDVALLVVVGEASSTSVGADRHVRVTGFVPEKDLRALVGGAIALVQPSVHESFSLVLCEAWALGRPVLVTGLNDVLVGQVRRSGGGLVYRDLAEYAVMLEALRLPVGPGLALGASGRAYVGEIYSWERVLTHYEEFLHAVVAQYSLPIP